MRAREFVQEGIHDPAIFKIVFVIGGPGSGKSYITQRLGLPALGYTIVNSDIAFEYLMRKHDIDPKMPPEEKEKRDIVRQRAKDITANKLDLAIQGRLGICVDGTGDEYEKIEKLKNNFDALGYDSFLVVVNTRLEVARARNQERARTVPDEIVTASWYAVQDNIGRFTQIFDSSAIIDNSGDKEITDQQIQSTYRKLMRFTAAEPNKPMAKQWMEQQKTIDEAAYEGNLGMMEMMKFFQVATPEQKKLMLRLIKSTQAADKESAWELLKTVTGVELKEEEFANLEEDWRKLAAAGALGASAVGGLYQFDKHFPQVDEPAQQTQTQQKPLKLAKQLTPQKKVFTPISSNPQAETMMLKVAKANGITGDELAQFLAQTKHESWDFTRLKEKALGRNYFAKKYDKAHAPGKAKILGNKKPGDGEKYHGRGFIQLTGRDNYRMAGNALDLPLLDQPELAATPEIAARIAVWYWKTRVKPYVDNFNDTASVTQKINPAMRGLSNRHENYLDYKRMLG